MYKRFVFAFALGSLTASPALAQNFLDPTSIISPIAQPMPIMQPVLQLPTQPVIQVPNPVSTIMNGVAPILNNQPVGSVPGQIGSLLNTVLPTVTGNPVGMPQVGTPTTSQSSAQNGLPQTSLDSFVYEAGGSAELIYGDEGVDDIPPYFGFDYSHRINAGITGQRDAGLTTGHGSMMPSAWGADEFLAPPGEWSMSGANGGNPQTNGADASLNAQAQQDEAQAEQNDSNMGGTGTGTGSGLLGGIGGGISIPGLGTIGGSLGPGGISTNLGNTLGNLGNTLSNLGGNMNNGLGNLLGNVGNGLSNAGNGVNNGVNSANNFLTGNGGGGGGGGGGSGDDDDD